MDLRHLPVRRFLYSTTTTASMPHPPGPTDATRCSKALAPNAPIADQDLLRKKMSCFQPPPMSEPLHECPNSSFFRPTSSLLPLPLSVCFCLSMSISVSSLCLSLSLFPCFFSLRARYLASSNLVQFLFLSHSYLIYYSLTLSAL